LLLGFLIGASSYEGSGAWADMFGPALYGIFGAIVGVIVGTIVACLPPVWRTFRDIPPLYYAPTAISVVGWTIFVFNIWRY
jgi:hypothetical protein